MDQGSIISKLQCVFDEVFIEPTQVTASLSARDVPEWDSLTHITLVIAVEKTFAVRFRVGEVEKTKNVGEFAELISKHLSTGTIQKRHENSL